jgi:hypothetical protein
VFLRMLFTVHSYPQRSHVMTGIIQGYSKMCSNAIDPTEVGPISNQSVSCYALTS